MQTIRQSIQFLQAIKQGCNLIDTDILLDGAINHLEAFQRRYILNNDTYIMELPKAEYVAWLKFREHFLLEQNDLGLTYSTEIGDSNPEILNVKG